MRVFLLVLFVAVYGCNTGGKSGKDDHNNALDDTARMNKPTTSATTISAIKILQPDIPAAIKVKGIVQEAWQWNDKLGENILITSIVGPYADQRKNEHGEEGQSAELHVILFQKKEEKYVNVWMLNDEEKTCYFDIGCSFLENSTTVTDLDLDGVAEIKVQYSLACRSDVSPSVMKLVMYENGEKYTLNGLMWVSISPDMKYEVTESDVNLENVPRLKDEYEETVRSYGRYKSEKDFAKAPPEFLNFARKEWLKYSIEKMGE